MKSKLRLITAILLVVALAVPFLSATPVMAQTCQTTYNFDVCAACGGAYYSDEEDSTPPLDNPGPSGPEATGSEYTAIATSDDSRWETDDPGMSDYVFLWLEMPIAEIPGNITNIELTFEGMGDDGGNFQIYAYNNNTTSWVAIGAAEPMDDESEETFSHSIPSSWADYLDGCGVLKWGVYYDNSSENIWVDYVKAVVTAGGSTTYDFSNVTVPCGPPTTYQKDVNSMSTGGPSINSELKASSLEREMIDTSDDSRWQSNEPGYQDYVFLQFEMPIAEAPGIITNIDLTWEGYGEITGTFQIWADDTTDGWFQVGTTEITTGSDTTMTHSITSNWANYINGSGVLTWAVFFNERDYSSGYWIRTDYVEAVISYPCPADLDYGDAPDPPYCTVIGSGGASHVIVPEAPFLGISDPTDDPDAEADGQPNATATGDDLAGTDPDDEDGVAIPTLVLGLPAAITFQVNNGPGWVDGWIDFNGNGVWGDILSELVVTGWYTPGLYTTGVNAPVVSVPQDAVLGTTFARFRINTVLQLGPMGPDGACLPQLPDGEVEDYEVLIEEVPPEPFDFGDAPAPYPTLLANNGARHAPPFTISMGVAPDTELDGQPTPLADGDDNNNVPDEDGVTNLGPLTPGDSAATVDVDGGPLGGKLDAWIDFNDDGDWDDAGEQIFNSQALNAGANDGLTFPVPLDAQPGSTTYARFRLSTQGGLAPTGQTADGEVEDYQVTIEPMNFDYGDAPVTYPTMLPDGARHLPGTIWMGSSIDSEGDGQPDDGGDEDGVTPLGAGPPATSPGGPYTMPYRRWQNGAVEIIVTGGPGYLSGWIDWNQNGNWDDAGENVFCNVFVDAPGTHIIDFDLPVPGDAVLGSAWARFRLSDDNSNNDPGGAADNGEVEDYQVEVGEAEYDFGDAPDPFYPTMLGSNGARHIIGTIWMGAAIDSEANGQPPDLDDAQGATPDDEDGVTFLGSSLPSLGPYTMPYNPGRYGAVDIVVTGGPGYLHGWIDWNQNGDWGDAGENVFSGLYVAAPGTYRIEFPVPAGAVPGMTWARFRLDVQNLNSVEGEADNGEVEDYQVEVVPVENPLLLPSCGMDIVLIMDGSGSITGTMYAQMQAMLVSFVQAFIDETPTQFAVVEFAGLATVRLDWSSDETTITNEINEGREEPGTQYTNWEQALLVAHGLFENRPENPNLIVIVSNGSPNRIGNDESVTEAVAMAAAILEANDIKNDGIRIVALPLWAGSGPYDNHVAISGTTISPFPTATTKDSDVITTYDTYDPNDISNYDEFAGILAGLAGETCEEPPPPSPPPPPPSPAVGIEVYPVNKLAVLAPWLGLALIILIGGGILVLRRRTTR